MLWLPKPDVDGKKFQFMLLSPAGIQPGLTGPRTCSFDSVWTFQIKRLSEQ